MTEPLSSAALAAAGPVVKEALKGLGPTIRRGAGNMTRHLIDLAVANYQIGFEPYLLTSYDRCRSVKTLLSQDRPLSLLEIYVHLSLTCGSDNLGTCILNTPQQLSVY